MLMYTLLAFTAVAFCLLETNQTHMIALYNVFLQYFTGIPTDTTGVTQSD